MMYSIWLFVPQDKTGMMKRYHNAADCIRQGVSEWPIMMDKAVFAPDRQVNRYI
jgi:hypothetical protein